ETRCAKSSPSRSPLRDVHGCRIERRQVLRGLFVRRAFEKEIGSAGQAVILIRAREKSFECSYNRGVELSFDGLCKPEPGNPARHGVAIRPIRSHCVVRVSDGDYPREQWDVVVGKSIRIPTAVDALMMMADDRRDFFVRIDVLQDALADLRVALHLTPLFK